MHLAKRCGMLRRLRLEPLEDRRLLAGVGDGFAAIDPLPPDAGGAANAADAEGAPDDLVRFRLELRDLSGNVLTDDALRVGQPLILHAYVQDQRPTDPSGVFAAYLDVTYDAASATVDWNEIQQVHVDFRAERGTFTLSFDGEVTAPIAPDATADEMAAALADLPNIELGEVAVSRDGNGNVWTIMFRGSLAERNVAELVGDGSDLRDFSGTPLSSPDNEVDVDVLSSVDPADANYHALPPLRFGPEYFNAREVDLSTDGLIDEVGAFGDYLNSTGADELLLFDVQLTAQAPGELTFQADPADLSPHHDVLLYDPSGFIVADGIEYGGATIDIVSDGPQEYVVDSLADVVAADGVVTLREALEAANTNTPVHDAPAGSAVDTDVITFAPTLFAAGPATITLAGTQLEITDDLDLQGPGADLLTIDADGQSRVMYVAEESVDVAIAGVMITGGNVTGNGGGIHNAGAALTISNSTLRDNFAFSGGGIYSDDGTLTVVNSTLSGNATTETGGNGGGIHNAGTSTVANSTLSGNSATWSDGKGGGIFNSGTLTVINSIVAGNEALIEAEVGCAESKSYLNQSSLVGNDPGFVRDPSDGGDGWVDNRWTPDVDESANNDFGDLRLTASSIAVGIGNNALLPLDTLDLDSDGDTTEPLPWDRDGNPRVVGSGLDLGAFEFQEVVVGAETPSTVVTTAADVVDRLDNAVSLREAIIYANLGGLSAPLAFDAALAASTMVLDGRELFLDADVRIDATAIGGLAIDGDGRSRVFVVHRGVVAELVALDVTGGAAPYGGAILNEHGTLELDQSVLHGNAATRRGGAIYSSGATTVNNSVVHGNTANEYGGGLFDSDDSLDVIDSTISGNSARRGGGIYDNDGPLTVTSSKINENLAAEKGGGIFSADGTITVTESTLNGNSADDGGGGIHKTGGSWLRVGNSLFSGNRAVENGAGIQTYDSGVYLTNSTVAGNTASGDGGGISNEIGTVNITNSIVAQNADLDVSGSYTDDNSQIGGDPLFVRGPSAGADGEWGTDDDDYGDLRLRADSPAIDAGDNSLAVDADGAALTVDLAGKPRVYDGNGDGSAVVDMGAFEFHPPWMNPVEPLDVNGDGVIVPLDALLIINELNANGSHPLPDPPPLDWGRYIDTNSDGSVAPIDALLVINHLNANTPASAEAEPDAAVAAATLRENTLPRVESRAVESKQVDGVFAQLAARNEHALRDAVPGWFKARGLFDDAWTGQGE